MACLASIFYRLKTTVVCPNFTLAIALLVGLLALSGGSMPQAEAQAGSPIRRVNALPFSQTEEWSQTAVFWFGVNDSHTQIPGRNYTDVRLGYSPSNLLIRLTVIDYYLWYEPNPTAATDLTAYDAITLYLDTNHSRAMAPQTNDYLFLFQARSGQPHTNHHRDARGNGASWDQSWSGDWNSSSFMDWSDGGPNNNSGNIDYGWTGIFRIPWATFGLAGPPPVGTVWGLGLQLFDRDDVSPSGSATVQTWPEALNANIPATWGELHIGPASYTPETTAVTGQTTIRAATPTDNSVEGAWMGGGGLCAGGHNGGSNVNHGADINLFTGSEIRATHFPCFNKTFLRFDLSAIPPGKQIVSAELTLNLWSHAGETPDLATRSWVSLHSIKDPWGEMSIHWNNAPLAYENISARWVNPYSGSRDQPIWPGDPYHWDASKAVAEAYAAGQPVSLALYGSDTDEHSSKYFYSSESNAGTSPTDARGRPSLFVTWGELGPTLTKTASPVFGQMGDTIQYSLRLTGSGEPLSLAVVLPTGLQFLQGAGLVHQNGQINWNGTPGAGEVIMLTFTARITAVSPTPLHSNAILSENGTIVATATTVVIANPKQAFLPAIQR